VSRRNRSNRRQAYGKRQHEVRERRPSSKPGDDWLTRDDTFVAPESIDDARRRDDAYDGYDGWTR
jgi:hypothetical protein